MLNLHQILVELSQFQASLVNFSQLEADHTDSYKTRMPEFLTNRKVGQNNTQNTPFLKNAPFLGVSETGSAKTGSAIDVRIDDAGSILKFRIGFSP